MATRQLGKAVSGVIYNIIRRLSSIRLRRQTAIQICVLSLIVVISSILRALPLRWGAYFTAFDPLFQYRNTEYVVQNGYTAWFSWHDTLSWYPWGRNIPRSTFPGLPFSAAFIYQVLQVAGVEVSVYNVCLYFPLLMAALTCIAAYFLGKDLGGGAAGLFAAFFMAITPAFIGRTTLGFFDTENIGIFGIITTSLFFLRSLEKRSPLQRAVYALASGLSLAYLYSSWGAARYITGVLLLFMLASLIMKLYDRFYLISFSLTFGIGYLFALFVPRLGLRFISSLENITVLGFIMVMFLFELLRNRIPARRTPFVIITFLAILFSGIALLQIFGLTGSIAGKFISVLDPSRRSLSPLLESVAEHKKGTWLSFFNDFGLNIPLAVLGLYLSLFNLDEKKLYGMIFFLTAIYFAGSMIRLSLILSIPMSLMAAYGLNDLLTPFIPVTEQRIERRRRRRRAFGVSREVGAIFTAFILVASLPSIWTAAYESNRPTSLAASNIPATFGGLFPQDWLQALSWMKDNLPEEAIVVSWWDYGYWIEGMANKTTLADGATRNTTQIAEIGKIMMFNQSSSLPILEKFGATHILVFVTRNPNQPDPNSPQSEWPWGDNVKWSWMVQIAGLNVSDYLVGDTYTAKFKESTLSQLMTMRADTNHFQLVFSSERNFVLVYSIKY